MVRLPLGTAVALFVLLAPVGVAQEAKPEEQGEGWIPWVMAGVAVMVGGGVAGPILWRRWQLQRWQEQASAHIKAGNLEDAKNILKKALQHNPQNLELHHLLGDTLLKLNQFTEALQHYQMGRDIWPEDAQTQLGVAKALQERARDALGRGKLADASRDFRDAIQILPQRGAATGLAHFGLAWALTHYDDRGHWMQSLNHWEAVAGAAPALAEASCARAVLDYRSGRYEEATAACWQALEQNESLAVAHHIMGQSFYRSGQTRAALSSYRIALSLTAAGDPFIPYIRTDLALALIQMGDLGTAEAELRWVQGVAPELVRVQCAWGFLLEGKQDYKGAAERFEAALKLNTNCLMAAAALALNQLTQKKLASEGGKRMIHIREVETSLRKFEDIISKDAQVAEAHFGLGEIARIRGGWVYAAQHYQAALAANGSYVDAYYRLGVVLARMGNRQEAVSALQRCLDIRPNHQEARANLNRLMGQQAVGSMTELLA